MASGTHFGYRRSLPHLLGVTLGFPFMFVVLAVGLGGLFLAVPALHHVMRLAGSAFILYIAFNLARADKLGSTTSGARPVTFWAAAAFQWANPKAWVYAVSAVASFTSPEGSILTQAGVLAVFFAVVTFAAVSTWCLAGRSLRPWLKKPAALRAFNGVMALFLAGSVVLIWI